MADGGPAPAFQLLVYPPTDAACELPSRTTFADGFYLTKADMDWYERQFLGPDADRLDPCVSPLRAENHTGVAPALVVTAGFDPLRDEGEAYGRKLAEAGVAVEVRRHDGLIHGFLNWVERGDAVRAANLELAAALAAGVKAR